MHNLSLASCVGMRRSTCAASNELRAKLSVLPARDRVIVDLVLVQAKTKNYRVTPPRRLQTQNITLKHIG